MTTSIQHGLCEALTISVTAELILRYLSLADVVALRCVCRQLRVAMDDARFNINTFLRDFVDDCESFRRRLGESDALLTGGLVLGFFETCHHRKIDHLDVLVQEQHADIFMGYLQLHENYARLDPPIPNAWGEVPQEQKPFILQRVSSSLQIRVKPTTTFPIYELLRSSYTTAQLNFMSWNKIYSLFPFETFSNHKFYPLRPLDNDFGALLRELAGQGWTTRDLVWLDLEPDATPHGVGSRRVGDALSAVIPIVPRISVPDVAPDYVIEHAEFELMDRVLEPIPGRRAKYRRGSKALSIRVQELNSPTLLYRYTTGHGDSGVSWRGFAGEQLQRWILIELYKIPPELRPHMPTTQSPPHQVMLDLPSDFQVPQGWDYADDQIPQWYVSYLRKRNTELLAEKNDWGLFSRANWDTPEG